MIYIALPMIVSNACETVMTFTDRLFLSKLGMEQMSAAMGGGLSVFFIKTFFIGLLSYGTAMTAQYYGAGEKQKCPQVFTQMIIISVLAYPLLLASKPLMHMLFVKQGISDGQLYYQNIYFDILLYASFLELFRFAFSNFFSGLGKTRIVMIASFGAMFVNMATSYVLIFGYLGFEPMGIRGAAYGSIAGMSSAVAILVYSYFRPVIVAEYSVSDSFKFDFDIIKKLFRFGTPSGIEFFMILFAFTMFIALFHSEGPVTAAATTIMFNWDYVSFVPLIGVEIGVTSLVGRYVGANRPDIVERTVFSGMKLGWMFSIFILVLFLFFPGMLSDVFRPEDSSGLYEQARPLAVYMIRVASVYILLEAVMVVYMGALKGAGDTFWSMIINVSFNWFIFGVLYYLLKVVHVKPETAWLVIVMVFVLLPLILAMRFRSGRWKQIQTV